MKSTKLFLIFLLISSNILGQKIKVLSKGVKGDSSFYHLTKISENEYWAGGEYGILMKIDSMGNTMKVDFPNEGFSILKIEKAGYFVFLATDHNLIYRYDIRQKTFIKKTFPQLSNKCFYDLIALKNGQLLVCGGERGISKAKKMIPRGFIATISQDLEVVNLVWHNFRKFVWSAAQQENGEVLVATFNGLSTKILKTTDLFNWKKHSKIKGLVHEIALFENRVFYSGAKSIKYRGDAILGIKNASKIITQSTGCLWSMVKSDSKLLAVSANGKLISHDLKSNTTMKFDIVPNYPLYDLEIISKRKMLVVGHNRTILSIEIPE